MLQIGRQAGGEVLESLAADAAPRRVRPQAGEAIAEIGGGGADGVGRHQRIAGGAGLAAPFARARRRRRRREPGLAAAVETGVSASCRLVLRQRGAGEASDQERSPRSDAATAMLGQIDHWRSRFMAACQAGTC